MLYQIVISEREPRNVAKTTLKPTLPINEIGYWQKRIAELISNYKLNEHATVRVAKE